MDFVLRLGLWQWTPHSYYCLGDYSLSVRSTHRDTTCGCLATPNSVFLFSHKVPTGLVCIAIRPDCLSVTAKYALAPTVKHAAICGRCGLTAQWFSTTTGSSRSRALVTVRAGRKLIGLSMIAPSSATSTSVREVCLRDFKQITEYMRTPSYC